MKDAHLNPQILTGTSPAGRGSETGKPQSPNS